MSNPWLDRLSGLFSRKKKPDPTDEQPEPTELPAKAPGAFDYLKAWQLLKKIPLHKLGSVVSLSAVIVFFAVSGVIAWLVVFVKFVSTLAR
jgi:hypothetical protein